MIRFNDNPTAIYFSITIVSLLLSAFSFNAHATLNSYTYNSVDLVYSSVSNVSWTKDANLLGTLIANSSDADSNGTKDVIESIVAKASGTVTNSDYATNGTTTWLGAQAFVSYLNSVSYAGVTTWILPAVATANTNIEYNISPPNGPSTGDEMAELFYSELNGQALSNIPDTNYFINENVYNGYWTGTQYASDTSYGWGFATDNGKQYITGKSAKFYVWAATTGNLSSVSAVPAPAAAWLFATVLPVLGAISRRRKQIV